MYNKETEVFFPLNPDKFKKKQKWDISGNFLPYNSSIMVFLGFFQQMGNLPPQCEASFQGQHSWTSISRGSLTYKMPQCWEENSVLKRIRTSIDTNLYRKALKTWACQKSHSWPPLEEKKIAHLSKCFFLIWGTSFTKTSRLCLLITASGRKIRLNRHLVLACYKIVI